MKNIKDFKCPLWEDLPNEGLRSKQVIEYIEQALSSIVIEGPIITATMIQNYRKWGVIDRKPGRMYYRDDIARLIVISIYKQILTIDEIKKGTDLSLRQQSLEKSYNSFASVLTDAISYINKAFDNEGNLTIKEEKFNYKEVGLSVLAFAYAAKLLGTIIIKQNGIKNLRSILYE